MGRRKPGAGCQNGHSVDVVSGDVVDQAVDPLIPGVIPLVWKRYYSSARRQPRLPFQDMERSSAMT